MQLSEEKNEQSGFKVVDRRGFSSDGSPRDVSREEPSVPESRVPATAPPRTQLEPAAPEDLGTEPGGFETLISYLSTTAMFQLGLLPGPSGEHIPADMENAQRTIDLLEVLQQKTRGNLTAAEARLLDDALYELRMTYVELNKRQGQKPK